jgi:hypothetical protein
VHPLVDSTGVKLSGPGEWLVEKHGTRRRWTWRKLHLGIDARASETVGDQIALVVNADRLSAASLVILGSNQHAGGLAA